MTMNLLHTAALCIPAVRRLRDSRDRLLAERAALVAELEASIETRNVTVERGALSQLQAQLNLEAAEAREARVEGRLIITEYPYYPHCRLIENGAGGKRLIARLRAEEDRYAETLRGVARHIDSLLRISRSEVDPTQPFWANDWFPPFDGATLYGLIAECAPRRYIEVGSGISTRFARKAINDLGLSTRIVSIDPHPHTVIEPLCDEVVRSRMEDVSRDFWEGIGPADMLFVDNSHRSFPNSDVTVFFAEVLPALRPGTLWGLHDIFLPRDYIEEWKDRFYNEQYLLLAYLLGGADGDEIVLPVMWASNEQSLHGIMAPLWAREELFRDIGTHGGCFWMKRGNGSTARP
jgi:predicted O-methyltransferase YrrM